MYPAVGTCARQAKSTRRLCLSASARIRIRRLETTRESYILLASSVHGFIYLQSPFPHHHQQVCSFSSAAARRTNNNNNKRKQQNKQKQKPNDPSQSPPSSASNDSNEMVRLSKRMSELDICSRREADRYIMEGRVRIGDQPVEPILGQKVPAEETDIVLLKSSKGFKKGNGDNEPSNEDDVVQRRALEFSWPDLRATTVILHKPLGYVSGQPEDAPQGGAQTKHIPAIRLLTPSNAHIVESNYGGNGSKNDNSSFTSQEEEFREAKQIVQQEIAFDLHHRDAEEVTMKGYVPAGRLDLNSSGLLLFTNNGVMAKKLISPEGLLEKEYVVLLEPVQSLTRYERQTGMTHLPVTAREHNTARMLKGGHTLWGDGHRGPLKPVVDVEWLDLNKNANSLAQAHFPLAADSPRNLKALRLVLKEGRKHQVRRMCRELLGMHVVDLVRTRIGPIDLETVPEGKWRPLRQHEAEIIYSST